MKKFILFILTSFSLTFAYCQYMSKSGEYNGHKTYSYGSVFSNKICVYGNGDVHIPVVYFEQYYCPVSIQYDKQRDRICDWN